MCMRYDPNDVYHALRTEKAMAPHSSTLAWRIPWTGEPGGLRSMGSLRVGHNWATSFSLFTFMHWRRKWQPTPVFLPGESQGRGSLVGCRLWGHTESDTLKWLSSSSSSRMLYVVICHGIELSLCYLGYVVITYPSPGYNTVTLWKIILCEKIRERWKKHWQWKPEI